MALTEEQLAEAKAELERRKQAESDRYAREWAERQHKAEEQFLEKMDRAYPSIDRDTRYSIWSDYDNYYR